MNAISTFDLVVIAVYLLGVTLWGAWLGRGQKGGSDYFLGNRELPWGAVMLSVVATETSTLTFLSIPGISYLGAMTFFQLTIGYLAGRTVVSLLLLPAYYRGELTTAYALLESRFGVTSTVSRKSPRTPNMFLGHPSGKIANALFLSRFIEANIESKY